MFKMSLKTRLVVYAICLVLVMALSFLGFYLYQMNNLVEDQLMEFGFHLAENLSYDVRSDLPSKDPSLIQPVLQDTLKEDKVLMAAVYDEQGDFILSSREEKISPRLSSGIKRRLIESEEPFKIEGETEPGTKVYSFFTPIRTESEQDQPPTLIGFARVVLSLEEIKVQQREIFKFGGLVTLLIVLVGSGMTFLLATRIIKPIQSLTKGAEEISKGNLDQRIEAKTEGEIKELAETFNRMAENLQQSRQRLEETKKSLEVQVKARTKELRKLNKGLEQRVQERTQELRKRIDELERFHRLAMGRELRMIELKKKIKELEQKLKEEEN